MHDLIALMKSYFLDFLLLFSNPDNQNKVTSQLELPNLINLHKLEKMFLLALVLLLSAHQVWEVSLQTKTSLLKQSVTRDLIPTFLTANPANSSVLTMQEWHYWQQWKTMTVKCCHLEKIPPKEILTTNVKEVRHWQLKND